MTPLEAILKIKAMFAEAGVDAAVPAAAPAPVDPAAEPVASAKEYQLKSGVTVVIDKLEIGGSVQVKDDAGQLSPAPAGDHELADGMVISVDDKGMIQEISTPQEEANDIVEDAMPVAPGVDMVSKLEEMQKQLDEMKSKHAMAEASVSKFSKAVEELTDIVIKLMETPSAQPTETPKDKFSTHTETYSEKVSKFLDLAKALKK